MKYLYLLISIVGLSACGGSEESTEESDVTTEELEEQINCESGETFIESYKAIREATITEEDGDLYTIKGEIFHEEEGLLVVSMYEEWGNYGYWVTVVLNDELQVDELEQEDGMFTDIQEFLQSYLAENYSVYVGRMIESPDYDISPYRPGLLEANFGYRDETDTYQHLCLINESSFQKTHIFAHTYGDHVNCEMINGRKEQFRKGNYDNQIVIDTEEYELDVMNNCEIIYALAYQRTWEDIDATVKNGEGPWLLCEYYLEDYFKELPSNEFYLIWDYDGDTLLSPSNTFKFVMNENKGTNVSCQIQFRGPQDMYDAQVLGMDQREDMSLVFYTKAGLTNLDQDMQVWTFTLHTDLPTNIYNMQLEDNPTYYVEDLNAYEHENEDDYFD